MERIWVNQNEKRGASHFRERDKLDLIYLHRVREIFKEISLSESNFKE